MEDQGRPIRELNEPATDEPLNKVSVRAEIPAWHDAEARFANHLAASFDGSTFVLTLAQVVLPSASEPSEMLRLLKDAAVPGRVLDRFAIPVDRWVEAIDKFHATIERMRQDGIIEQAEKRED